MDDLFAIGILVGTNLETRNGSVDREILGNDDDKEGIITKVFISHFITALIMKKT